MLRFWLDLELATGLHGHDEGISIVEGTARPPQGDEDRLWLEEGPSLRDIEAMQHYIQRQLPDGWRIVDGEVKAAR